MAARARSTVLSIAALLILNVVVCHGSLQKGFYNGKCKSTDVESTIQKLVAAYSNSNPRLIPQIMRMCYHDCQVRGCDASILLNGPATEKTAGPNLSVGGFDLIDKIKAALEKACPGVVSCADIIIAATRDAIVLGGGKYFPVVMGRRDGTISKASEALASLPPPDISVQGAINTFASLGVGLTAQDSVLLMGAHTVGIVHCSVIGSYIWSKDIKKSMDPTLVANLRSRCPQSGQSSNTFFLDQETGTKVDSKYYYALSHKKGMLPIDGQLIMSGLTNSTVLGLASGKLDFNPLFAQAVSKLSTANVLTGTQGQIRKVCWAVNTASPPPPKKSPPPPPPKKSPPPPPKKAPPPPHHAPPPPPSKKSPPPPPKKAPPPPHHAPPPPHHAPPPPPPKKSPPPPPHHAPPPPPPKKSPPPPPKKAPPPPHHAPPPPHHAPPPPPLH